MRQSKVKVSVILVVLIFLSPFWSSGQVWWNQNHLVGTLTGKYHFTKTQTPDQLVEINPPSIFTSGLTYQWESSILPISGFVNISGASQSSYTIPAPLPQTTYFRRKTTLGALGSYYSNIVKITVVNDRWEDANFIREHDIRVPNVTNWDQIDQTPIGQRLESSTYFDGLGRSLQQVSKQVATPENGSTIWGDVVKFSQYDSYGREVVQHLPFITTQNPGKLKPFDLTPQQSYHQTRYGEGNHAFISVTFDNSPLNRVVNVKKPGYEWANSAGDSYGYELNTTQDEVRKFTATYVQGASPVYSGVYPSNSLLKQVYTDVNGKKVVEFLNMAGELILKKVQLSDNPGATHEGWICTYNVYDDFGQLRFILQPEAVKYLSSNSWSFAGSNGTKVLNDLCFQYYYDDRGREIWTKKPGAGTLLKVYDPRDRLVFTQDGKQALTGEWTAVIYDELDRPIKTILYKPGKTLAQLQQDANLTFQHGLTEGSTPVYELYFKNRIESPSSPRARTSITIQPLEGDVFETNDGEEYSMEIDPDASVITTSGLVQVNELIPSAVLQNTSICTIIKEAYYDNYAFSEAKPFNAAFENGDAYSGGTIRPIASSARVMGALTGTRVRVLGTGTFLNSTFYYDEEGNSIQVLEDNFKGGVDISTTQYDFDGRVMSTHSRHTAPNTGITGYSILNKYYFDVLGRITSLDKKFGTEAFRKVVSYEYDPEGRVKKKRLAPGYTAEGKDELEALEFSYNIHGNLTGINKDYALKTPGKYQKWGHFFGLYLGYDNRDNAFTNKQLDGHIAGVVWSTLGDDVQRKNDFVYDNSGRLSNVNFTQRQLTTETWSNNKMDFSVSGQNGKIEYDLNGNILWMRHKGVVAGTNTPIIVDDLRYTYETLGNKLNAVTDLTNIATLNGKFGDFKDGDNLATEDYVYDLNGNLIRDENKKLGITEAIKYNFLDKPEKIVIAGKGTVEFLYDASGRRLQKKFTPSGGGAAIETTYINQYVYQGNTLQYINFEEGRVRVITPVSSDNGFDAVYVSGNFNLPGGKAGVYDYFVRDYQDNVRMILTEEANAASGKCTMETNRSQVEEPIFGQVGSMNEVLTTRFSVSSIPGQSTGGGWQNGSIGSHVSRLGNVAGKKIGPGSLLKVMAGDVLNTSVQYYYKNAVVNGTGGNLVQDVVSALAQSILANGSASDPIKGATGNISGGLLANPAFGSFAAPDAANASGNKPKAYLSVLFFDERFNFVADGSAYLRVSIADVSNANLVLSDLKAPKNGYAFVYISNESDEHVYFDNLQVAHIRGRIVEENHFYAFGLRIEGISSRKASNQLYGGHVVNYDLYNDKELFEEGDLDWHDYGYRNYDAQIGKFVQADPVFDIISSVSQYHYAFNDPIGNIDLDGLIGIPCPGASGLSIFLAKAGGVIVNSVSSVSGVFSVINIGATVSNVAFSILTVSSVSELINGSYSTASSLESRGFNLAASEEVEESGIPSWRVHFVYESMTEEIYKHTVRMLSQYPNLRVLTYNGGGTAADKNRKQALKKARGAKAGPGHSWDEFPYAIAEEGGMNAQIKSVPVEEQEIQKLQLSVLVTIGGRMKKGDKIFIYTVPKGFEKQPFPSPERKDKPWFFPVFPRLIPIIERRLIPVLPLLFPPTPLNDRGGYPKMG